MAWRETQEIVEIQRYPLKILESESAKVRIGAEMKVQQVIGNV